MAHYEKLSVFYTNKLVNSYFHLCKHGYNHNHVDVDALAVSTSDIDEDLVALYLGYYNWGSSHLVVGLSDLDNPCFVRYL